jgi:DNA polymerase-3 subunit alpha
MAFVHLRTHSEYSVVDGMLRIDDAARAARADEQPALALSDLNNLFGAVQFYKSCRAQGVKPIIGVDLWMQPLAGDKQPSRLLLLVQNKQGYLNLCELLARGWTTQRAAHPGLDQVGVARRAGRRADLRCRAPMGIVGCGAAGRRCGARRARRSGWHAASRAFLRRAAARRAAATRAVRVRCSWPRSCLPVVATHPVQFLASDDFEAHEARVCIAEGETLANPKRVKRFTPEQHFKTQAQMQALFADVPRRWPTRRHRAAAAT